jgi:cell division protein FtsW
MTRDWSARLRASLGNQTEANEGPGAKGSGRSLQLKIDLPFLLVVCVLLVYGLLMVYSASYDPSFFVYDNPLHVIQRQVLFVLLGIGLATGLTFIDYHFWQRLAIPAMAVTVLALLAVLVVGEVRQGAVRTLVGGSVQPSELAKMVIVLYLSIWLYAKRDQLHKVSFGLIPLAVMLGILGGLIYVQPDLSAVITILFLGGLMFFLAGGDLRQIAILAIVGVIVAYLVIQLSATGSSRIGSYIAGLEDPMQASPHVRRSLEAFVNGKWLGVGIGEGQTKLTGLPVPHTDSIFAVIGEETGVFGALLLVGLFTIFMWRGLKIAQSAPDELGALMAAGLTLWISFEAFINMAVMLNLVPFAGNALPFISAGGSSMAVTMLAVGILLNISRLSVKTQEDNRRFFGAVADLRWRDRGWRVSRAHRSARTERDN